MEEALLTLLRCDEARATPPQEHPFSATARRASRARRNRGFVGCQIRELAYEVRRLG
jgi:hypothetical protein